MKTATCGEDTESVNVGQITFELLWSLSIPLSYNFSTFKLRGYMPYINLQITQGASREQKAQIVKDMTNSLVKVLGKRPEHIHIVIQEIKEEDWGFEGMLTDDWKKLKK